LANGLRERDIMYKAQSMDAVISEINAAWYAQAANEGPVPPGGEGEAGGVTGKA